MIIQNEVQEAQVQPLAAQAEQLATVSEVHGDGVVLQFDGEDAPRTGKRYKVNTACTFSAGQRVYVVKISGSYLVVCPVGNPQTT